MLMADVVTQLMACYWDDKQCTCNGHTLFAGLNVSTAQTENNTT
jgi:hypothetical protein